MKKYLFLIAIISLVSCSTPDNEIQTVTPDDTFINTGYIVEEYPEANAWGWDNRNINGVFNNDNSLFTQISIIQNNSGTPDIKLNNEVLHCNKSYRSYYFYENSLNTDSKIYYLFFTNDRIIGIQKNKLTNKYFIYFPQTPIFFESVNAKKLLIIE